MMMLEQLQPYYQHRRVFVTGHTGFKGTWLLALLQRLGATVSGYALPPQAGNQLFQAAAASGCCTHHQGNILDRGALLATMLDFEPDMVFHLAAQSLVRKSYQVPADTFAVNAQGTVHVLDALRELRKPCVAVLVTTDKVYQNNNSQHIFSEGDRLGGFDPYSASKACAELVISSYRNAFFNPAQLAVHGKSIASARSGNVIGGGDWAADRVIPDLVRALEGGQPLQLRNPHSTRPWQHVLEPLWGYLLLAARLVKAPGQCAEAYNFGPPPGDVCTVRELVQMAINAWGGGSFELDTANNHPHEAAFLQLNIQQAVDHLAWQPRWTTQQAVEHTMRWYRQAHAAPQQAWQLVHQTITDYFN